MRKTSLFGIGLLVVGVLSSVPAAARGPQMRVLRQPGTSVPTFVTGIEDIARFGPPQDVARDFLDASPTLHGIDTSSLRLLQVEPHGSSTTVRFAQSHRGVPVWGAQYLVHLTSAGTGYRVSSTNGHVFSALDVDVEPAVDLGAARQLASLRVRPVVPTRIDPHGLEVLPFDGGVLIYRFTVWGSRFGAPAKQELFINAHTGATALSFSNLHTDAAVGSGVTSHGETVELRIFDRGAVFELRDQSRSMFNTNEGEITTHDARGSGLHFGTDENIVKSPTRVFEGEDTDSGAVDAHYNAGKTYEFFEALGRNSIDDRGADITSTVNVSQGGRPLFNAFWDGQQMVYGNPAPNDLHPLSAALDVVAHELTHGVTQHSGNLAYLNQSGAMNEAYSDYFGEAVEVNVSYAGDMNRPDAGEIGEDLCRHPNVDPAIWQCPLRDLNDERGAVDHIYYLTDFDSGGVHFNSTIYAGALWDIREAIGGAAADRYIYTALRDFTDPLQDFYGGRLAIVEAARSVGAPQEHIAAIEQAFDDKGIVQGWDTPAGGIDGTILLRNVAPIGTYFSPPQVSGERFVIGDYKNKEDICCRPLQLFVGNIDGSGQLTKVGEDANPSTFNDEQPDLSGKRVVWSHSRVEDAGLDLDVHTRVLGGSVKTVASGPTIQWYPSVSGNLVAWENLGNSGTDIYARYIGKPIQKVVTRPGEQFQPQVRGDWVAWWDVGDLSSPSSIPKIGVKNLKTGKRVTISPPSSAGFIGPPGLGRGFVYWYQDSDNDGVGSIMRAPLGSTQAQVVVPEDNPNFSPIWIGITAPPVVSATKSFITYSDEFGYAQEGANPEIIANADVGRDAWLVVASGGVPVLVTENRGDQAYPVMASGGVVLWLDSSQGRTDLMRRNVQ
ncbi:MAG: M4 family metallopeptidase [Actinomycetota bacterium]